MEQAAARQMPDARTEADTPPISAICRLFELAARSMHSAGFSGGLYPAQWTALRYLATSQPTDRTSAKLARFQQVAVGSVTRTVRTLISKGLVVEGPSAGHHRSKQLDLTRAGIALLRTDPLIALDQELASLPQRDARIFGMTLARVISVLHDNDAGEADIELALDADT
jgi:DNA-binding MarR family transcriptional regulator